MSSLILSWQLSSSSRLYYRSVRCACFRCSEIRPAFKRSFSSLWNKSTSFGALRIAYDILRFLVNSYVSILSWLSSACILPAYSIKGRTTLLCCFFSELIVSWRFLSNLMFVWDSSQILCYCSSFVYVNFAFNSAYACIIDPVSTPLSITSKYQSMVATSC